MNAELEITFAADSSMIMNLNNALLEEFADGYSLHADNGLVLNIMKSDLTSFKSEDDIDEFCIGAQGIPTTIRIKWE